MPKARVRSAAQVISQRKASVASANKRRKPAWPAAIPGSFGTVRRHKLGGKAYQKKTGDSFKPAPEALAILAGSASFRDRHKSDMESNIAMAPLRKKPAGYKSPDQLHGSGTGLTAGFRYHKIPHKSKGKGK